MAIFSKTVTMKWNGKNKKYYEERGYSYSGLDTEFIVKVEDLKKGSHFQIKVICDYCNINTFPMEYKTYNQLKDRSLNKKDSCKDCMNLKRKEVAVKHHKLDFEIIRRGFKDKGLILLSNETDYENFTSDLEFRCPKHIEKGVMKTQWGAFRNYAHGCKYCGQEATREFSLNNYDKVYGSRILPYELNINIAREDFKKKGLILVSTEYQGNQIPLEFICPKHENKGNQTATLHVVRNINIKNHCKYCHIESVSGENSHLWRGGLTEEKKIIRDSFEFKRWRESVFERDCHTCQACGDNTGGNLNAHHIENFSDNEDKRFDINNGITLCENCHLPQIEGSFHYIFGTSKNTKEQLEEYLEYKRNYSGFDPSVIKIRRTGKRSSLAKFNDEQVLEIRARLENGEKCVEIAKDYNVTPGLIQKIKAGVQYKNVYGGTPIKRKNEV